MQSRDPFFLGNKIDASVGAKVQREGLVTLQVSGACGGNSRSLLTNANDVQGVNEKYRGKTLFLNLEGKKKRRKKKKRTEDIQSY